MTTLELDDETAGLLYELTAHEHISLAQLLKKYALVPKLQLGNPDDEALASRDRKLELAVPNSQAGAWELAKSHIFHTDTI